MVQPGLFNFPEFLHRQQQFSVKQREFATSIVPVLFFLSWYLLFQKCGVQVTFSSVVWIYGQHMDCIICTSEKRAKSVRKACEKRATNGANYEGHYFRYFSFFLVTIVNFFLQFPPKNSKRILARVRKLHKKGDNNPSKIW